MPLRLLIALLSVGMALIFYEKMFAYPTCIARIQATEGNGLLGLGALDQAPRQLRGENALLP